MSRSNKEGRLNHSGTTIKTGHGGLKRNMGAGGKIKPKEATDTGVSGIAAAKKKQGQPKKDAGAAKPASTEGMESSGKTGWAQVGESGAAAVKHYNEKKKSNTTTGA